MPYETLLYDKKQRIGYVTLNRPTVLNAQSPEMFDELAQLFGDIKRDPEVGVVILTGAGDRALACHIRLASENARFGQPEINLGLFPGAGGTQRLPRLVGKGIALEMMLTGEAISAQEAHRVGLVNKVVPATELMPTAA